ncbi:DUF7224 domain-containing protein [Kribbella sp. CA-293567]|uniref:DUF7224 domain-containing protein n=1 Tax=Kribbella sp. CA-293567 TaxID=3002436 RepID=UPI0022DDB352|nr:hypothetical protein [Kribbella sp. CA-293567]WBQ04993.1 hypothetical protein OX958_34205 [Kribbella sp. CA-293567]
MAIIIGARAGTVLPGWYNSVTLASVTVMLVGPLCFGVTALRRQSSVSSGLASVARTTVRGEAGLCLVSALAVSVWGVAALTAANGMAAVRAIVDGLPDWRIVLLYLLGVSAIGTAAAAGAALARFATTPITVGLVSIASVIAILGVTYLAGGLRFVSPIDPSTAYFGWNQPNAALTAQRIGLTLAVGVSAVVVWVAGRSWRLVVAGASAVAALALAVTLPGDLYADAVIRSDTENRVCSTGSMPVCVWPEHVAALPAASEAAAKIAVVAKGSVPLPAEVGEPGTLQQRREGLGVLQLPGGLSASSMPVRTPTVDLYLALAAAVLPEAPPCAGDPVISARRSTLFDWLLLRVGASQVGVSKEAMQLVKLRPEQQEPAVRALAAAASRCP